jgi:hypothetical protein
VISLAKLHVRFRIWLSRKVAPPRKWSRLTHTAYPEIHADLDGSWAVRFQAYDAVAWNYGGERHEKKPSFPEPRLPHPNTWHQSGESNGKPIYGPDPSDRVDAQGNPIPPRPFDSEKLAQSIAAWATYYAVRPIGEHLVEEFTGKERDRASARKAAAKVAQKNLDKYRRVA